MNKKKIIMGFITCFLAVSALSALIEFPRGFKFEDPSTWGDEFIIRVDPVKYVEKMTKKNIPAIDIGLPPIIYRFNKSHDEVFYLRRGKWQSDTFKYNEDIQGYEVQLSGNISPYSPRFKIVKENENIYFYFRIITDDFSSGTGIEVDSGWIYVSNISNPEFAYQS